MTKTEYEQIKARIVRVYRDDLAALDRIWDLIANGKRSLSQWQTEPEPKEKLTRSEAMQKSWEKRRAEKGTEKFPKKKFKEFLANGVSR